MARLRQLTLTDTTLDKCFERLLRVRFTGFSPFGGACRELCAQMRAEIHFHLLPGVDDGPATIEDSLELARLAAHDGTRTIVATPHIRHGWVEETSELPDLVREVQRAVDREAIPIRVVCGGEICTSIVGKLTQADLARIAVGPPGSAWLLLECPFDDFAAVRPAAQELRDRGFTVVLAHPERSAGVLAGDCRELRAELAAGSLAQINVWSLAGGYDEQSQIAARQIVRRRLAGAIASDSHPGLRKPALALGMDLLMQAGETFQTARVLAEVTPRVLVAEGLSAPRVLAA